MPFHGNVSLTTIAANISTKPAASFGVTSSPYKRTENNTPNTDSKLKNSDAWAGGTYFSATF